MYQDDSNCEIMMLKAVDKTHNAAAKTLVLESLYVLNLLQKCNSAFYTYTLHWCSLALHAHTHLSTIILVNLYVIKRYGLAALTG